MSEPRVVIVGAGMGGLSSALLLAHQGLDVTVVPPPVRPPLRHGRAVTRLGDSEHFAKPQGSCMPRWKGR